MHVSNVKGQARFLSFVNFSVLASRWFLVNVNTSAVTFLYNLFRMSFVWNFRCTVYMMCNTISTLVNHFKNASTCLKCTHIYGIFLTLVTNFKCQDRRCLRRHTIHMCAYVIFNWQIFYIIFHPQDIRYTLS